jgi:heme/copper-type cytochrome/quinol oxidase subunit 2
VPDPTSPIEDSPPPLDAPLPGPPPYAATPGSGPSWAKIAVFGCLGLFVLLIVIGAIGFFVYRMAEDRENAAATTREETTGGGAPGWGAVIEVPRQVHAGTLGPGDETQQDGSWYDAWPVQLPDGARIVFLLESDDFDTYLIVVSPGGEKSSDDDSGGGTNSRIELTAHESGTWNVLANSLRAGDTGDYRLTIESR